MVQGCSVSLEGGKLEDIHKAPDMIFGRKKFVSKGDQSHAAGLGVLLVDNGVAYVNGLSDGTVTMV